MRDGGGVRGRGGGVACAAGAGAVISQGGWESLPRRAGLDLVWRPAGGGNR
ncbi:hypothetical protein [Nonomuraea sp. NPDC003709]|uniref:hypothetical protein n=1 Tax=Nonomuraea sp. NPDC003709 TaxID=3154450 RepID=UPI0033BF6B30